MKRLVFPTNDSLIRTALKGRLQARHSTDKKVRIIEELGILHGDARIDIVVINGIMHGYEIKSDQDTLRRLPEQVNLFSTVFDKLTLVVGKSYLYDAVNLVPDWWGIMLAKVNSHGKIVFSLIRKARSNKRQSSISIARLLWRDEALHVLEEIGEAKGFYSKPKESIYKILAETLNKKMLKAKVNEAIFIRSNWRSDVSLALNGD